MKRVNGCMLQHAQETIQYAVGFDMPEDTPAPRRLQLETAIRLLTERCLVFETFHGQIPQIYARLESFYDQLGWAVPRVDQRPPAHEWTDPLVKCCRCREFHSPVSLVCTQILGVYTPTPMAMHAAAHGQQINGAATTPAARNGVHTAPVPAHNPTNRPPPSQQGLRMANQVTRVGFELLRSQAAFAAAPLGPA